MMKEAWRRVSIKIYKTEVAGSETEKKKTVFPFLLRFLKTWSFSASDLVS